MFNRLLHALKLRAFIVGILVHLGLLFSVIALVQAARSGADTSLLYWLAAGITGFYGGFLTAVFFVVWPLLPWIRRARRILQWREWILEEIPKLMALVPVILQLIKSIQALWNELKTTSQKPSTPVTPLDP